MSRIRINRRKEYREQLKMFINMSNALRRRIRQFFKEYSDLAEGLYEEVEQIPQEYYDDFYKGMLDILNQSAREIIVTVGNRQHRLRLTKQENEIDPIVLSYVASATAQNVTNITQTTRKKLQAEIALGLDTGLSINQISKNIKKSTAFSAVRATLIARTESHQAMSYGNQEIAKRLGLQKPQKEWVSAMDDRTRDWHRQTNGQRVGIDDAFTVLTPIKGGGVVPKEMQYTGDPEGGASNVINCRCFVIYYDEDDIVE